MIVSDAKTVRAKRLMVAMRLFWLSLVQSAVYIGMVSISGLC